MVDLGPFRNVNLSPCGIPERILYGRDPLSDGCCFGNGIAVYLYHQDRKCLFQEDSGNVDSIQSNKNPAKIVQTGLSLILLYPEPESNRHGHCWPLDFKSSASTSSAIRANHSGRWSTTKLEYFPQIKNHPHFWRWKIESGKRDSDPRPRPWQGRALPTELFPQMDCKYSMQKPILQADIPVFLSDQICNKLIINRIAF